MLVLGPRELGKGKRPLEEEGKLVQIQGERDALSLALELSTMELGEKASPKTRGLVRGPYGQVRREASRGNV